MDSKTYYARLLPEEEQNFFHYMPTINDLVSFAGNHFSDDIALDGVAGPITYRALIDTLSGLRGFLKENGINPGDKVGIQLPNSALAAELILSVMTYGAVIVPFPMTMNGEELLSNLRKMDISIFIYADMLSGQISTLALPSSLKAIPSSKVVPSAPEAESKVEKGTPAAIFFTGGTTGKSKGALLSHGALMRGAFNGVFAPPSALRQRYLALIPFSHVFGVVRNLLTCFYTGSLLYTLEDMRKIG